MTIFLNGDKFVFDDGKTIEDLIREHRLAPETTLVELNGTALRRREWTLHPLHEGDRVEILRVAAGG
jgi:sulfur carrier protein